MNTLELLAQAGLLNDHNKAKIINPYPVSSQYFVLADLLKAGLLTQDNFDKVVAHLELDAISLALSSLSQIQLLNQDRFIQVISHEKPWDIATVLKDFETKQLLDADNFNKILAYPNALDLASSIDVLESAELLNQANFDRFVDISLHWAEPCQYSDILYQLRNENLLTQNHLDSLFEHHSILCASQGQAVLWNRCINLSLAQLWSSILEATNAPEPFIALAKLVREIKSKRLANEFSEAQSKATLSSTLFPLTRESSHALADKAPEEKSTPLTSP